MEIWRPVHKSPFSDFYLVSNLARVKSLSRTRSDGKIVSEKIMTPVVVKGYQMVPMTVNKKIWYTRIHLLVAFAFIGPPPGDVGKSKTSWQINHIDGNKFNNIPSNLEWVTPKQNSQHAAKYGLKVRGEKQHLAKLTDDIVREMLIMKKNGSRIIDIANAFGIHHATTSSVFHRRTWKHVVISD